MSVKQLTPRALYPEYPDVNWGPPSVSGSKSIHILVFQWMKHVDKKTVNKLLSILKIGNHYFFAIFLLAKLVFSGLDSGILGRIWVDC